MKPNRFRAAAVVAALILTLAGCNSRSGWGVVLWTIRDADLRGGSIVRILTESHINNVYIVQGDKKPFEVPLWQVKKFRWRNQASAYAASYDKVKFLYAVAQRDGLPVRDQPDNNAKRVYKLKEGQTVKILEKTAGAKVSTGDDQLSGDWYLVLTDDGTIGYCFSFALAIYDESTGAPASGSQETSVDPDLERFYSTQWRPDYFRPMVETGQIDLDSFGQDFGFFVDRTARTIAIKLPQSNVAFGYSDVSKLKPSIYRFEGAQLIVTMRQDGSLLAQYQERGSQKSAIFIPYASDVQGIVDAETARRTAALAEIIKKGNELSSSSYGTLQLSGDGRFVWKGYSVLQPSVVPADAGNSGRVEMRLFLDPGLKASFDGALSLAFDGVPAGEYVNFLYKRLGMGVQFEYLPDSAVEGVVAKRRSSSPVVVFFAY